MAVLQLIRDEMDVHVVWVHLTQQVISCLIVVQKHNKRINVMIVIANDTNLQFLLSLFVIFQNFERSHP